MAATDALHPVQFPVSRLREVSSYEYDMPVSKVGPDVRKVDERRGKPGHMEDLRAQIRADGGIREPVSMINHRGRLWMEEGHHRAVIAQEEGHEHIPAIITRHEDM